MLLPDVLSTVVIQSHFCGRSSAVPVYLQLMVNVILDLLQHHPVCVLLVIAAIDEFRAPFCPLVIPQLCLMLATRSAVSVTG